MKIKQTKNTPITLDYDNSEVLQAIKNSVAQDATPAEFRMFIERCKASGLNPFKREIWFICTGRGQWRKVHIMTGIAGCSAIANSYAEYDGLEVIEGPNQTIIEKADNGTEKQFLVPEWVEVKVHRKDRKFPSVARAYWHEYGKPCLTKNGNISVWGQYSRPMLIKCAKMQAFRDAFPQQLGNCYIDEEMPDRYDQDDEINITPDTDDRSEFEKQQEVVQEQVLKTEELQRAISSGESITYLIPKDLDKEEKQRVWSILKDVIHIKHEDKDTSLVSFHVLEKLAELEAYLESDVTENKEDTQSKWNEIDSVLAGDTNAG